MKKNISINISGIIFHIEEDGYETLKKYLDSINKYFSSFEDSSEILADIESRIAEIFLSRLNEEKQVITTEDVNALVTTMGSVRDFKAAEEAESTFESEPAPEDYTKEEKSTGTPPPNPAFNPSKRLLRDQKRKIMGGVCAGLGNYFSIDPLWIRLLFALLFFAYGITLFVYIIMWIVVPGSYDLDEPVSGKKMFRDPETKIIGGVSGGVAAFLGIDILVVRVLFVVLVFGAGLGLFLYIVLWLILPEARTLTDRVQMQGEPVTLSNIESTIKKNQTDKVEEEESTLTKVILFPFRLIGMILTGLGKILVPILEVIRVGIGILIVLIGITLVFGIVVSAGILFGIVSAATFSLPWMSEFSEASVPIDIMLKAFPAWTAVAAFLGTIIPSIFLVLLGVSVIAKRIVFTAAAGWSLFVLFFISVAMLSVGIPKIVFSFKEDGEFKTEENYTVSGNTAVFRINEVGMDDYDAVRLHMEGYYGKDLKLVQSFEAQGNTRAKAIEHARMISYNVVASDSVFTFDSNVRFRPDATFRAQRLNMNLYVPYDLPFTMDEGFIRLLDQYIDWNYRDGQTWKLTEDDGLECISCPESGNEEEDWTSSLSDFDELELTGRFDVRVSRGHEYAIELIGPDNEKEKYKIYKSASALVVEYTGNRTNWDVKNLNVPEMRINITMPSLEKLEATGLGSIRFDRFDENDLELEIRGPVKVRGEISAHDLSIFQSGKSEVDLSGVATNLNAQLELASRLRAYNLDVTEAIVEVSGASNAKVNVSNHLEIEEGVASKVDYRGHATVVKHD